MEFQTDEWVVHCTHGLGQIKTIEQRSFGEQNILYYMIQIGDLTIWVPADENIGSRLRYPQSPEDFQKLFAMLNSTPEALPIDRRQRNQFLLDLLKDGSAESLCRALRDMSAIRKQRTWGDYDRDLMKRIQKIFLSEWCFVLSTNPHDAEAELQRILAQNAQ